MYDGEDPSVERHVEVKRALAAEVLFTKLVPVLFTYIYRCLGEGGGGGRVVITPTGHPDRSTHASSSRRIEFCVDLKKNWIRGLVETDRILFT